MTREEAIEVIKQDIPCEHDTDLIEALDMAIKSLEQLKWIPVSEGLPKEYRFVNCTCHSLIDDREDWVVETVYIPQPPDSPYSEWGNIPMLNWKQAEVVAWMYRDIPEPYQSGWHYRTKTIDGEMTEAEYESEAQE